MKNILFLLLSLFFLSVHSQENSVFWEIRKDTIVRGYILGTNHIFGKSYVEKDNIIFDALKSSSIVILENIKSKDSILKSRLPFSYVNAFTSDEKKMLKKITENNYSVNKFTPRELLLMTQNYWDKLSCLDEKFKKDKILMDDFIRDFSLKEGKKVVGLEKIEETLNLIETLYLKDIDESKIIASLKYRLMMISKGESVKNCEVDKLYEGKRSNFDFTLDVKDELLYNRNNNWESKILAELQSDKTTFIAVGLAHLDYQSGLISILRMKGYTINPIQLN